MMDRYYPSYHFRPEKNWMNDPNGLIYHNGCYHMFFQYNPNQDVWGDIHWGHAKSKDLIHWEMCPIALEPSYERGELHCYSGCCTEYAGQIYAYYTSVGKGNRGPETGAQQWSAISTDKDLIHWEKDGTPALDQSVNGDMQINMWRDPFIWKEHRHYFMLLSGTHEGKGCICLYESKDLSGWAMKSLFYESREFQLIECPNILKFGDRYLLLYSPLSAVRYAIGTIDEHFHFIAEKEGIFDYSIGKKGFYAPNTFMNLPDGRYITFGCLFEGDRLQSDQPRGWAGIQSLPREIRLFHDTLHVIPAAECRALRKQMLACEQKHVQIDSCAFEAEVSVQRSFGGVLSCSLFESSDRRERTIITVSFSDKRITLDRSHSTVARDITTETIEADFLNDNTEESPCLIDLFVDHSTIELFFDGQFTMSARVFPMLSDSIHNEISFTDGLSLPENKIKVFELSLETVKVFL